MHALSILPVYWELIRTMVKHVEFRVLGRFRGRTDNHNITHILFYVGGASTTKRPLLVRIAQIREMTVAHAVKRYPTAARLSNLATTYARDRKVLCIELTPDRQIVPIVLMRPLNVFSKPQSHRATGHIEFCLQQDVGKNVKTKRGQQQLLLPTGFSCRKNDAVCSVECI